MSTHRIGDGDYPLALSGEQWRQRLSPEEFHVLREGGTERPFTGQYEEVRPSGTYACRGCGAELFTAETQFNAHCGWPAFYAPTDSDAVELLDDDSLGMRRTEVRCRACGSHLGHVFRGEGFPTPTDERFCINSICLVHSDDAA
ncbi:peptide-methionine (R)-S-oxide reductase MsrB [Helcobacillus massiliensis]|uniref:peptide-methionine (R)-S-oxide reductase MsrB n=1 Tax=Helcobacillus massiliensis TaxID=521392 RepID=UPI0021A3403F|nr:peptide-methionine (R)-S-oxide reductase MsrB [Helcobacillus massiliensis]MCT1557220.1 peptide-methionine (R)-S-oxide reductase MsrB [Helcobacillus massiliensis]MCT2036930.1 peptide-methionine (R)-S-oxide reductase MsrB [Helcobacillus massiliensis]MCT2332680.1 peptide-methionine (R)-S-oxide reductase MsrB [Helcobacillus massiliensis]